MEPSFYDLTSKEFGNLEDIDDPRLKSFQSLLTKVPVGVYIFWIRAIGTWEFEYVSNRWCELHQIERSALLKDATLANSLVHSEEIDAFVLRNKEALLTKRKFEWEGRFVIGGNIRWFRLESEPIFYENGDSRWYGVAQDITERKKSEQLLQESEEKLKKLNAEKDKFFSIIAHDLKDPFNAIMGVSELLLDEIKNNEIENLEAYTKMIWQSSKKATDLLINLLEWTRAHTGRMIFNPQSFCLMTLIHETISLFETSIDKKKISMKCSLSESFEVMADKQMIATILRNLLSNAIKYTNSSGTIEVQGEDITSHWIVMVKDNGIGISPEKQKKLFQLDSNYTTPGTNDEKGTGLGLLLCKEFVEKHGGRLWVESQHGCGSTFKFTISKYVKQS